MFLLQDNNKLMTKQKELYYAKRYVYYNILL